MNNVVLIENSINQVAPDFNKIASHVNFEKEAQFAIQLLKNGSTPEKDSYLLSVAKRNPESLKMAIMSIATIGISLNPATKHAYLVPRDGKICLDVSYMGLVHLACDSGAIKWVQASVVYSKDRFSFSLGEKPKHEFNPFGDRGEKVGVYCLAKTEDDEFLCEFMTIEEVYAIRNRTDVWKKFEEKKIKSCPWSTDENEMIKKTVIKRASKLWPKTDKLARLHNAIEKDNELNGINFKEEQKENPATVNQLILIREKVEYLERNEEQFCSHLSNVCKRKIEKIEELTEKEADTAIIQLSQFCEMKKEKEDA